MKNLNLILLFSLITLFSCSTEDNAFAATGIDTDWRSDAIPYDYFNGVHKSLSFFTYCPVRRF